MPFNLRMVRQGRRVRFPRCKINLKNGVAWISRSDALSRQEVGACILDLPPKWNPELRSAYASLCQRSKPTTSTTSRRFAEGTIICFPRQFEQERKACRAQL